jgi:hypothetical protein
MMRALSLLAALLTIAAAPAPATGTVETIVLLRHGEKPPAGLGQLSCQGLNRALRLPAVLQHRFGRPDAIFAPDPAEQKPDSGQPYDYDRPLATIEPTAIGFGLPIQADLGVSKLAALQQALEAPRYHASLILVAWEHTDITVLTRALLAANGGDPKQVGHWPGDDFDSLYVLRITRGAPGVSTSFTHLHQGLDGQPTTCPAP